MRNKLFQKILDETPEETKIFVEKYGDLVVRISELLKEKSLSQKDFAEKIGQKPSAVSRWLSGSHNITLRSIAKMEAELGEDLIQIPQTHSFSSEIKWAESEIAVKKSRKIEEDSESIIKSRFKTVSFPLNSEKTAQPELFDTEHSSQIQLVA